MFYEDPLERHQKSRIFNGLVVELQFAEWLETLGWTIVGLEAFRDGPDIEARGRLLYGLGRARSRTSPICESPSERTRRFNSTAPSLYTYVVVR